MTVGPGGFVAVPPGVVRCFVDASDGETSRVDVHAPDPGSPATCAARDGTPTPDRDDREPPADGAAAALAALGVTVVGVVDRPSSAVLAAEPARPATRRTCWT